MKLCIRSFVFILSFCLTIPLGFSQKTEIGVLAGGSYYYGDILNSAIQPKEIHPALNVFLRYHINKKISLRGNLLYCRVSGADSNLARTPTQQWQHDRNLAFYSDIIEVSGMVEYNLRDDLNKGRRVKNRFIPYVFGGVGLFYFEPKAIHPITGKAISLRPLQLDGSSYLPVAIALPIGVGLRFYMNRNWQLGFEFGMRLTSTSHLDDVTGDSKYPDPTTLPSDDARIMSVRNMNSVNPDTQMATNFAGKPRGKIDYITDVYFVGGITLSYRLWPKGARTYHGTAIRCPRFY
jgi:hypothetical protein